MVSTNKDAKPQSFEVRLLSLPTFARRIYVNLEIDYITTLIQKFSTICFAVQTIGNSNVNNIPIEEEMFLNMMNITECLTGMPKIHVIATVRGNFTKMDNYFDWLSSDSNNVPPQIQSLCDKEFIFKLRLNNFNLKEGLENYTVSKLLFPDEKSGIAI
nr:uncharacterized protein LOC104115570 isoform X1 [Nicotiana tomentosiformis]